MQYAVEQYKNGKDRRKYRRQIGYKKSPVRIEDLLLDTIPKLDKK